MRAAPVALAAIALLLTGCGSGHRASASTSSAPQFAPFTTTPPAAVGSGLVCGAAADRVLGISDPLDLLALGRGAGAPQSPLIREGIAQYASGRSEADRERAAGLIVGQCAAYGFYTITYHDCLRPMLVGIKASRGAVERCIEHRRWTLYTQQ